MLTLFLSAATWPCVQSSWSQYSHSQLIRPPRSFSLSQVFVFLSPSRLRIECQCYKEDIYQPRFTIEGTFLFELACRCKTIISSD